MEVVVSVLAAVPKRLPLEPMFVPAASVVVPAVTEGAEPAASVRAPAEFSTTVPAAPALTDVTAMSPVEVATSAVWPVAVTVRPVSAWLFVT